MTWGMLTVDWTSCPRCGGLAEVEWRAVLESTAGPFEHAKVRCVQRHWFLLPTATLPSAAVGVRRQRPGRATHKEITW